MLTTIIVIMGSVLFAEALLSKWGFWYWLASYGSTSKSKFVYNLTSCQFCLRFHLTIIVTALYGLFFGFPLSLAFVPVVVAGLITLKN